MPMKGPSMTAQPAVLHPVMQSFPAAPLPGPLPDPKLPMKVDLPVQATLPIKVELLAESAVVALGSCRTRALVQGASKVDEAGSDSDTHAEASTSRTSSDSSSDAALDTSFGTCTTVAIMNIPYTYPMWKLQAEVDAERLPYDYFHFPRDNRKGRNRGFAFVNFMTTEAAKAFHAAFHNRLLTYPGDQEKRVAVTPSSLQGFEGNAKLHPLSAARTAVKNRARGQCVRSQHSQRQGSRIDSAGTTRDARHPTPPTTYHASSATAYSL